MQYYNHTVVGGHLIVVPNNIPGRFKVDATSDLAKRVITTGSFEPKLTALLKCFSDVDGDVVNIGANIGFYTVYFASQYKRVRKVIAIEPNPEAFSLLRWNVEANHHGSRVEALRVGIGDAVASMELAFVPGKSEYSSLKTIVHPAVGDLNQEKVVVDVMPLEKAVENLEFDPSLIFIDTEGAELLVLRGAKSVLRKFFPLLVFECEDALLQKFGHSSEMIDDFVKSLGYEVRDASMPEFGLVHPFTGVAVAIPKSSKDRLEDLVRKSLQA
jgi:FkbM family methyltransferase